MSDPSGGIHRTIVLLRFLATADGRGRRLKDIADAAGLPRPTTHRILASLVAEGMVERDAGAKVYRLGLDLFMLAARAGNPMNLRELCRPGLLRLTGSLGETIFLLVRSGFDAICIDRTAGLLPIRSFTGDIGGSVMLGIGQGAMAILAHLAPGEQDEVIRCNLPRMRDFAGLDEALLRTENSIRSTRRSAALARQWKNNRQPVALIQRAARWGADTRRADITKQVDNGSSASCTTISNTSTWSRKPCNHSTTRSARDCHPCLGYGPLPICLGNQFGGGSGLDKIALERVKGNPRIQLGRVSAAEDFQGPFGQKAASKRY
jgi:DNA-binding IclR family transcriptional regulator